MRAAPRSVDVSRDPPEIGNCVRPYGRACVGRGHHGDVSCPDVCCIDPRAATDDATPCLSLGPANGED
jgi:hypothetical protein